MKLDNSSGVQVVSEIAAEMKMGVVALCGERSWGETRQRWLERGARLAGISYRSARSLFYAEDHEPRASTVEKVRAAVAAQKHRRAVAAKQQEASLANEYSDLLARIARLEEGLREARS